MQLLRDTINKWLLFLGDKNGEKNRGTLMARMASEKSIKLNSSLFKRGIAQFENNFTQILSLLSKAGIPVFVGTLSSNLLDQQPFITFDGNNDSSASKIYFKGLNKIERNNFFSADSLLKLARDLDGLRFRAPSDLNSIIKRYSKKYNYNIIDIEKEFNRLSPQKIVGNNLMVDHLHPTLEGHFIIAQLLFEEIHKNNFLPNNNFNLLGDSLYSFVRENFNFSKLDSLASELRILNLLNDYPFVESKNQNIFDKVILQDKIDTLALRIARENYNWEKAHQEAYLYYLSNNEMDNFIKEINVLISQYPYKLSYYNYGAQELILRKRFNEAEKFLIKRYSIKPDDFSTKWLGNINLSKNNIANAIKFLNESLKFNPNDAQVFYNLSIANIKGGNIKEAIAAIQGCLKLKPDYPNALNIYKQLSNQ
jgi:tetratricopeptide (TPR) repeat protein